MLSVFYQLQRKFKSSCAWHFSILGNLFKSRQNSKIPQGSTPGGDTTSHITQEHLLLMHQHSNEASCSQRWAFISYFSTAFNGTRLVSVQKRAFLPPSFVRFSLFLLLCRKILSVEHIPPFISIQSISSDNWFIHSSPLLQQQYQNTPWYKPLKGKDLFSLFFFFNSSNVNHLGFRLAARVQGSSDLNEPI